ncbi:MAG: VUT family protein [Alphaproteobacteria bacterium]
MIYLLAFLACIPAANWLIGNFGTVCPPGEPCLIPVWHGLMAPSGVLVIGVALVLRDIVQERMGVTWTLGAIVTGAALSAFIAPPALVIASAAAFLLSELADMLIYTPLRERRLMLAVVTSGAAGAVVDSAVFLWLAFGSLTCRMRRIITSIITLTCLRKPKYQFNFY